MWDVGPFAFLPTTYLGLDIEDECLLLLFQSRLYRANESVSVRQKLRRVFFISPRRPF